jgi:ElaB/YqjD/DUF883 family membrane-anchored ribosome-binding protein
LEDDTVNAMRGNPVNRLEHAWSRPLDTGVDLGATSTLTSTIKTRARSVEKNAETFIGDHPRLSLAFAAAAGLLLGWMVKRK